jgi:hypothetical protein
MMSAMRLVVPLVLVALVACGSKTPREQSVAAPTAPPDAPEVDRPDAMTCHKLAAHLEKLWESEPQDFDNDTFIEHCTEGYTREQVECALKLTTFDTKSCLPHHQWAD